MMITETQLQKKTIEGVKWVYFTQFFRIILNIIVLSVLARMLDPEDFGIMALAQMFVEFASQISLFGIDPALIQKKDMKEIHVRIGFTFVVFSGLICTFLIYLLSPLAESYFNSPGLEQILEVIAVSVLIFNIGVVSNALLRKNLRFKEVMISETVSYVLGFGGTAIILASMNMGVWSLVFAYIVSKILFVIMNFAFYPHKLKPAFSLVEFRGLIFMGGGFSFGSIFARIASQIDSFIIGRKLGINVLGYYNRASYIAKVLTNNVSGSLGKVLFPAFSQIQDKKEILRSSFTFVFEIMAIISMPLTFITLTGAEEIVMVILGPKWNNSIPILQILSVGITFKIMTGISHSVIRAIGKVYKRAFMQFATMIFLIFALTIGSKWGVTGVAFGFVISIIFEFILFTGFSLKLLGITGSELFRIFRTPVASAGSFMILFLPLYFLIQLSTDLIWLRFIAFGIITILSFLISILIMPEKFFSNNLTSMIGKIDYKKMWYLRIFRRKFNKIV